LAYGSSPFDGSATAASSGNVPFPASDRFPEKLHLLIKSILNPNPSFRPTLKQLETALSQLSGTSDYSNPSHV
jgi:hypothetical protein